MKNENQLIQWVENKDENVPECHMNRSHADPTADKAIGNVMQEERQMKRKKSRMTHTWKKGTGPLLKEFLKQFDDTTVLHIGAKTSFYFIGTVKTLEKDIAFVEYKLQKNMCYRNDPESFVSVLNRKVLEVYPKYDPEEGMIIKTEGPESGSFWFDFEYQKAKNNYLSKCRKVKEECEKAKSKSSSCLL